MARLRPNLHGTLLLLTVVVLATMAAAPARRTYDLHRQIDREEERLEALERENVRLTERLHRLEDPEYQEKLAREQLGLVRPGETAYVIVPTPTATAAPDPEPEEAAPWYRHLWDWVKGLFDG